MRASNQMGRAQNPPLPDLLAQGWAIYSIDYRTNPRYTLDPLEWDDTLVAVGSCNLDALSLNQMDESAVLVDDARVAEDEARRFLEDLDHSKELVFKKTAAR